MHPSPPFFLPVGRGNRSTLPRGAAYEKAGQYALALADCSVCLSRDVGHEYARLRKSRVLEALGKEEDALSEVCAHLLLERDRVQAKVCVVCIYSRSPLVECVRVCVFFCRGW